MQRSLRQCRHANSVLKMNQVREINHIPPHLYLGDRGMAADLCKLERQNYLIVTDYYSQDAEIANALSSKSSSHVFNRLKVGL